MISKKDIRKALAIDEFVRKLNGSVKQEELDLLAHERRRLLPGFVCTYKAKNKFNTVDMWVSSPVASIEETYPSVVEIFLKALEE